MDRPIRRIVFVLLQMSLLSAAIASSNLGQSAPFDDSASLMPVGESQPIIGTDTPKGIPAEPSAPEIGPFAQAVGAPRNASDNFPPPPSRNDAENPTLTAIKALSEQVKTLESRIVAQDARIATLERALDDLQRRSSRYN